MRTMSPRLFIGVAWPYANGSLHLGHVAGSLLPPDIFRRYHKLRGHDVLMVSGSDEHGTPITVTAEKRGTTPGAVADQYHREHVDSLRRFGIEFDLFFRTSDPHHKEVVWDMFNKLAEKGFIFKKQIEALRCPRCDRFLPDRYVEGTCPHCGAPGARGDQCDDCGKTLDPADLKNPRCKICGSTPVPQTTEHFFFRLTAFQKELEEWLAGKTFWRPAVMNFTRNWLKEGLRDRAITRDLSWGVEIPVPGYDSKRIYVWFEAVIGYLSASKEWARRAGKPEEWKAFWQDPAVRHYYFLGKDNVPFHTIIWPSILLGHGGLDLPYDVPANEFLSFGGEKFSKSKGIGIELPPYLARFDPDPMRYYLTINMPDTHDTDFTWEEFVRKNNDELVGTLGNFVNRVLQFTYKNFGMVPDKTEEDELDRDAVRRVHSAYDIVGRHIEACDFKLALKEIMSLAQFGNRFIDTKAPWKLIREDKTRCGGAMSVCLDLTKALCMLVYPFLPFTGSRLWRMLGEEKDIAQARWEDGRIPLPADRKMPSPAPLFRKLELDEVLGISQGPPEAAALKEAVRMRSDGNEMNDHRLKPVVSSRMKAANVPPEAAVPAPDFAESAMWFDRALIKVGRIKEVVPHPQADKLYITTVDLGDEERRIVAGMRLHYKPEEMVGKLVATIVNLEPAKLRGVESAGMIFAFDEENGKRIAIVVPDGEARPGERIFALGRPPGEPSAKVSFKDFGRIQMKGARISAIAKGTATVEVDGRKLDVKVNPGFRCGQYVAVILAGEPAVLVTESGRPLTAEREMPDGCRVR